MLIWIWFQMHGLELLLLRSFVHSLFFVDRLALITEDRSTQFAEGDPNALLLLPQVKRGYARTAFSSIVDMVKLHAANAQHLAAGGWGECAAQQRLCAPAAPHIPLYERLI